MLGTLDEHAAKLIAHENAKKLIDNGRIELLQEHVQQNAASGC